MTTSRTVRSRLTLTLVAGLLTAGLAALIATGPGAARALPASPGADCQPYGASPCLLPFPNNLFTRPDHSTPTGLRVHLPAAAMPVNTKGQRVGVAEYDRNDGFSPGSDLVVHVPGLDNPAAFRRTGAVGLANMAQAFAPRQPIVVIDARTGLRQLVWSELDANASGSANSDLLIHPGRNFTEGHTYIVALRSLRTAAGRLIGAPLWFERLRDGRALPVQERGQRARYARIFAALGRVGIARSSLYEAWDFTIASTRNLTGRMLAIRNSAFGQLGDHNLSDGSPQGVAPSLTVTSMGQLTPQLRSITGTFRAPCYLTVCGPSASGGFHYGSGQPDALPTQPSGSTATAPFECIVPSSATALHPARISLYGHGLLGSHKEVEAGNVQAMSTEHNIVFCATDWWGLAQADTANDAAAIGNLNLFPGVIDRLQQGVLNTLFLGRAMFNTGGFASRAAFRSGAGPVIDTSHLYYDGNSQGGIEGGMMTAVAPDFRRAVLGVSGMNYGNVLVARSVDFTPFGAILNASYPDQSLHPLILDLIQQLWDRGDPDGYAQQMTAHPLPDTPSHQVLMQIAYGDHQVSIYAAAIEARTIGALLHAPALDLDTRGRDRNLFFGVPAIGHYPFRGSAIVIWDGGPGHVQPPPFADVPPGKSPTNQDPHEDVRNTPAARLQKSEFLAPDGAVFDVCSAQPCRTAAYTP